jgi:hypothetical protein
MKELVPIEESWSKKRVFLGLIVLAILIAGLATFKILVLDKNQDLVQKPISKYSKNVEGASTNTISSSQENAVVSLKTNIQNQLNAIKQEASSIDLTEIATSSPQVKKIIEDIKSIQNLPKDKAKDYCEQICNGL